MISKNIFCTFCRYGTKTLRTFGRAGLMLFNTLVRKPNFKKNAPLFIEQLYNLGVLSILITVFSGFFIGMVLGLQGYAILSVYGAETSLGMLVSLSLFRELGPVITALLFIGRSGSTLTAEISLMRVTEQISSMEMLAIDPLCRIISPRFWAGIFSLPLLTIIFIAVGIFSSSLIGVQKEGIDVGFFWSAIHQTINFRKDLVNPMVKSLIFSIITTWISLFNGYDTVPSSDGISRATTSTVVYSSLAIFGLDYLLTSLMF